MGDLLDAWVIVQDERADLSDASKTCYRYKAGYWKDALGDVLAARLDRVDAEETVRIWGAGDAPVAPRTIKTAVRVLALAVRWGAARGHCSAIDLKGVAPTIREDERVYCEHTPLPAEALRVISLVPNIDKRDALLLQAITGARVGEIAAATGADYSPATGKLQLHGKDPGRRKRGKTVTRRFPLPPEGRAIVEAAIERNGTEGYLFPAMGNHPAPTQNNALKIACKAAGTPRFSTHALRRMVVMRMLDAGINAKTASKLTGHSVKTLLMHYVRPTEDALVRAVGQADLGNLRVGELIELPAPAEEGQEAAPAAASA